MITFLSQSEEEISEEPQFATYTQQSSDFAERWRGANCRATTRERFKEICF